MNIFSPINDTAMLTVCVATFPPCESPKYTSDRNDTSRAAVHIPFFRLKYRIFLPVRIFLIRARTLATLVVEVMFFSFLSIFENSLKTPSPAVYTMGLSTKEYVFVLYSYSFSVSIERKIMGSVGFHGRDTRYRFPKSSKTYSLPSSSLYTFRSSYIISEKERLGAIVAASKFFQNSSPSYSSLVTSSSLIRSSRIFFFQSYRRDHMLFLLSARCLRLCRHIYRAVHILCLLSSLGKGLL